jgi:hypothetical protein
MGVTGKKQLKTLVRWPPDLLSKMVLAHHFFEEDSEVDTRQSKA